MREFASDPAAKCELCGQWMPIALLTEHMALHGYDPADLLGAEIVDLTVGRLRPVRGRGAWARRGRRGS